MNHPTPAASWRSANKQVMQEIMGTDILCRVLSEDTTEAQMLASLEEAFTLFRDFAERYSRFSRDNDLFRFNQSEGGPVSRELFQLLQEAKHYHEATGGLFDPSILVSLEEEGYTGAYKETAISVPFSELRLDQEAFTATKPLGLKIDLGGIGKGFIADKVSAFLREHYQHFLVDAGGDIFASGENRVDDYPYWAVAVEHPLQPEHPAALLILSDMAVATSGKNRKHWTKDGIDRHHLIDPKSGKSAETGLISVTVVAESVTRADVFAKTLFIAGRDRGTVLADTLGIPALFISQDGSVTRNRYIEPYVWKQ